MKYSINDIRTMIAAENRRRGIEAPNWNTIGSVKLYQAYGAYAIDEIMNEHGGAKRLFGLDTKNAVGAYLDGMRCK